MAKNKKGFTLAEVLVTLAIIGVVAALTIPTLIKSYQKQQWVSAYKKEYATIEQATKKLMEDNGGTLLNAWGGALDHVGMYNAYLPYLSVIRKCENELPSSHCFAAGYVSMSGGAYGFPGSLYSLQLADGASLIFHALDGAGTVDNDNFIILDINGKKGPNMYGRDYHSIHVYINSSPVKPERWDVAVVNILSGCPDTLVGGTGFTCGARILRGDYGKNY